MVPRISRDTARPAASTGATVPHQRRRPHNPEPGAEEHRLLGPRPRVERVRVLGVGAERGRIARPGHERYTPLLSWRSPVLGRSPSDGRWISASCARVRDPGSENAQRRPTEELSVPPACSPRPPQPPITTRLASASSLTQVRPPDGWLQTRQVQDAGRGSGAWRSCRGRVRLSMDGVVVANPPVVARRARWRRILARTRRNGGLLKHPRARWREGRGAARRSCWRPPTCGSRPWGDGRRHRAPHRPGRRRPAPWSGRTRDGRRCPPP